MNIKTCVFLLLASLPVTVLGSTPNLAGVNRHAKIVKVAGDELPEPRWRKTDALPPPPTVQQLKRPPALSFGTLTSTPKLPGESPILSAPAEPLQKANATASDFVPLCTTLSANTYYTLSGAQTGDVFCYHFNVPIKAKTTIGLLGQSETTDFALYLFKDDGQNNLEVIGASDNASNANEVIQALTEAGDYYWYFEANAADGSEITLVALVEGPVDDYEINDSVQQSYALPDKLNVISGNSDSNTDIDYYSFTAIRGQDVRISFTGLSGVAASRWILEIDSGGQWVALNTANTSLVQNLQANQVINIRVSPSTTSIWSANAWYQLTLGSQPRLASQSVSGESNVLRIPNSAAYPEYMTTQANRTLTWSSSWTDSKNSPLVGLTPVLYVLKRLSSSTNTFVPYVLSTGNSSSASGSVTLGTCNGDLTTEFVDYSLGYKNTWRTEYNFGYWHLKTLEAPEVGVGGSNVPYVTLGHICKQTLLSSTPS